MALTYSDITASTLKHYEKKLYDNIFRAYRNSVRIGIRSGRLYRPRTEDTLVLFPLQGHRYHRARKTLWFVVARAEMQRAVLQTTKRLCGRHYRNRPNHHLGFG